MDLTAAAFGLLVTTTGGLFAAVVLLVRRELDHAREHMKDLDDRLRAIEDDNRMLRPISDGMRRKLNEAADPIVR